MNGEGSLKSHVKKKNYYRRPPKYLSNPSRAFCLLCSESLATYEKNCFLKKVVMAKENVILNAVFTLFRVVLVGISF